MSGLGSGSTLKPAETSSSGSELSSDDFEFVKELVATEIAVQLDGKAYLVESRLAPVARQHELSDLTELVDRLRTGRDRDLKSDAIEAMTTNETSFFRDSHPFDALADHIIPQLLERTGGRGPLTIWNAACSSGQESLSVAIMISEKFPELAAKGRTRILATDVSPAMVTRSKEGIYSRFEMNRGLPAHLATKYFEPSGRHWAVKPELLALMEVRPLNLIQRWSGVPKCDVVMLRNVLIYFPPEVKSDILTRIRTDVLKPSGCLLLGASESTSGYDDQFRSERLGTTTIFVPEAQ